MKKRNRKNNRMLCVCRQREERERKTANVCVPQWHRETIQDLHMNRSNKTHRHRPREREKYSRDKTLYCSMGLKARVTNSSR